MAQQALGLLTATTTHVGRSHQAQDQERIFHVSTLRKNDELESKIYVLAGLERQRYEEAEIDRAYREVMRAYYGVGIKEEGLGNG